jgi:hypothetical protein
MAMKTILLTLVVLILAVSGSFANPITLSTQQRARLDRGDVVLVDVLPPGGSHRGGQGGTALALVNATPDAVWRVIVDYPHHSGVYPKVVDARVISATGDRSLVRYTVGVGPFSFGFHVDNYPDALQRRLVWELAHRMQNDLFKDSWGYWQVEAHGEGSLLTYAMAARTVLPSFLTRGAEREGLVETIKAVRNRAEQPS